MKAARAVLWDMDGTLIDSGEYHWLTWRDTLAELGVTLTRDDFAGWFGALNDAEQVSVGPGRRVAGRTWTLIAVSVFIPDHDVAPPAHA